MDPVTTAAVARIVALASDADNPFGREPETGLTEGEAVEAWCEEASALVAAVAESLATVGLVYVHTAWQEVRTEIAKLAEWADDFATRSEEHEAEQAGGYTQRELPGLSWLEFPDDGEPLPAVFDNDGRQLADWEVQLLLNEEDMMGE